MENNIAGMKEKTECADNFRKNTRSKIEEEDGFIVEIDANTEASKRGESFENMFPIILIIVLQVPTESKGVGGCQPTGLPNNMAVVAVKIF